MRSTHENEVRQTPPIEAKQVSVQSARYSFASKTVISLIFLGFLVSSLALVWVLADMSRGIF
jgi:hypothetical protein